MRVMPTALSLLLAIALLLPATAARAQLGADGAVSPPDPPAPTQAVDAAGEPAPPADPAPAEPPAAAAPGSTEGGGVPIYVSAAQYAVACLVPMVLASIPFIGWIAQIAIPLATGWLVQVVGDAILDRSTSPVPPIVGAFIGNCLVMPLCTGVGVVAYFGLVSAGVLSMFGLRASGIDIRAGVAAFMGLGATGIAALLGSLVVGFAAAAAVPVAAYALFSEDEDGAAAPQSAATPTRPRLVRVGAAQPAAAMAY